MKSLKIFGFCMLLAAVVLCGSKVYAADVSSDQMRTEEEEKRLAELKKEKMKKLERQMSVVSRAGKASAASEIKGVSKNIKMVSPAALQASSGRASSGAAAGKIASAGRQY